MLALTSSTIKSAEATPASQSFKDLMDVMYNCAALPNQSYEESCGKWYEKFKDQFNQPCAFGKDPVSSLRFKTPALQAAIINNLPTEVAITLLKHGADVNGTDAYGRTAIHIAASDYTGYCSQFLDLLISAGANINLASKDGYTPLHDATRSPLRFPQRLSNIQRLVYAGAAVNAQNSDGRTPLNLLKSGKRIYEEVLYKDPDCDHACKERCSKSLEYFRQSEQFLIQNGAKTATSKYNASIFSRCAWLGGKYCKLDQ